MNYDQKRRLRHMLCNMSVRQDPVDIAFARACKHKARYLLNKSDSVASKLDQEPEEVLQEILLRLYRALQNTFDKIFIINDEIYCLVDENLSQKTLKKGEKILKVEHEDVSSVDYEYFEFKFSRSATQAFSKYVRHYMAKKRGQKVVHESYDKMVDELSDTKIPKNLHFCITPEDLLLFKEKYNNLK